jgi:hypothetical protein
MGIATIGTSGATGKTLYVQKFTTVGPNTFTLPSGYGASNPLVCEVLLVGGGGGAGHYTSYSTYQVAGGGGGGGGVKRDIISLTDNATAYVGDGGPGMLGLSTKSSLSYGGSFGGIGETSWFGTSNGPANLIYNPNFIVNGGGTSWTYANYSNNTPPINDGAEILQLQTGDRNINVSSPTRLYTNKQYTFSIYVYNETNPGYAATGRVYAIGYNSGGSYTGIEATGTFTYQAQTWQRISVTFTPTTPYIAFAVQRDTSTGFRICAPQLEIGSSATTWKGARTSGYTTHDSVSGSVIWSTSDNVVSVAGGGGGAGDYYGYTQSNSCGGGQFGTVGATGGGGAITYSGSTYVRGGNGGGAGGDAKSTWGTLSAGSDSAYVGLTTMNSGPRTNFGRGSAGQAWATASNNVYEEGAPGIGLEGFGIGGFGYQQSSAIPQSVYLDYQKSLKNNTGKGGDSLYWNNNGSYSYSGQNGSSGLVVVKYWA